MLAKPDNELWNTYGARRAGGGGGRGEGGVGGADEKHMLETQLQK